MDIILATETCAIDLKNNSKETDMECLCQKISTRHIFNRNLNIKLFGIISQSQKKMKVSANESNKEAKIYQFNKSSRFVLLSEKTLYKN